ncbi:hypothetical protein PIB30_025742 [Stylosanthes scabra]|uniref:Uncharacterized protein n=1 Tax=Stylosanthes scabra TaxID=79078 RepID=A0ABU6Q9N7_9FABA|nr:hypothetical protein [Stylosanthes scabra]
MILQDPKKHFILVSDEKRCRSRRRSVEVVVKRADGAAGAIFDTKHLEDSSTSAVFDYK